ncbi:MAG: F0F1 ATP synthase subunit delta [Lachnospiraceae bacterium]|nr:F0F1 ATP synthase subunit delta [Lachnospiraceae bacterium]
MAKLVSKTYGDALFDLALEKNCLDAFMEESAAVKDVFVSNSDLMTLLKHPKIVKEEKIKVIESVFKGRVSDEITGLLCMLLEKGHAGEIISVMDYFTDRAKEYRHIGRATVTSAMALDDAHKKKIEQKLLDTTDYVSFEVDYRVDPTLIGGIVIRIGDKVLDGSIRTRINNLTQTLRG